MKNMTLAAIAQAVNGTLYKANKECENTEATCVVVDSRKIEKDGIFVATKGAKVDGHSFINQTFENGALGVICEDMPDDAMGPCIVVEDSFQALKALARYYRQQLSVTIVGVIGSVGKTSTKEVVAAVLSSKYSVLKTEGNYNNEVGVPLTIFRIQDSHEMAVVEMGISEFGEMDRLGDIVKPDIIVFTCVAPCHLEQLGDLDGVLRAKSEVISHMNPEGMLFLNGEDEKLNLIDSDTTDNRQIIRFGINELSDDVYATNIESLGLDGSKFILHLPNGDNHEMMVPLPGIHMVYNALAAAGIGYKLGLSLAEIKNGMASVKAISGRGHLIHANDCVIVDDCYNANPKSMKASIDLMKYAKGRKVAILGDMFELGDDSENLHSEVGEYAATHGIDLIICVGTKARFIYDSVKKYSLEGALYFENKELLFEQIDELIKKDDTILIKASHGMNFTEIVTYLSK